MVIPLQKVTHVSVLFWGAWFGILIFQKFQINITEKRSNIFVGYHFFLGLKNCKQDTFHKVDLLIAFALWTQFKQTAKQATIQAFMRACRSKKIHYSAKLKMLQIPLVTLQGMVIKGVDIFPSGEQIMAYFKKEC